MSHPQVPAFGDWEEEDVPYTAYFEKAGKGKKRDIMKKIDPPYSPEAESKFRRGSETPRARHEHPNGRGNSELRGPTDSPLHPDPVEKKHTTKLRHDTNLVGEEVEMKKPTDPHLRPDTVGRKFNLDSPNHRYGSPSAGDTPRRASRQSVGSDRSVEHSPLHPKVGVKGSGVSSPSWERKGLSDSNHGLGPATPGRSRLRSVTRGNETPDQSPAVPKFGEWDETDPASAEGFTHIFERVREDKQTGAGKVPVLPSETSYSNSQKTYASYNSKSTGCGCFPWSRR